MGFIFDKLNESFFWAGYIATVLFYSLMFFIGSKSGEASKKKKGGISELLLAGRGLPLGVALLSMTATWVGGGFINGTAESVSSSGLVWTQAPWGYALSLIIGGVFFAKKMRDYNYTTLLDPIHQRFGKKVAGLLYTPALLGEIFWTGAILTALGTTFGTILGISFDAAIILSALVAISYTALGGMKAVANTDVLQLSILIIGLWITIIYVLPEGKSILGVYDAYQLKMGHKADFFPPLFAWNHPEWGLTYFKWLDSALLLIFGGIPWHVYFQRVLSSKNGNSARWLSIGAAFLCLFAAIPAIIIGMVGAITDWQTLGINAPASAAVILPHVLLNLTPIFVATIGLGALSSAVMSSTDSSILSASSLGAWNIYKPFFMKKNDDEKLVKVVKKLIWIIGIAATIIALKIKSVYSLWFLCSDFVYCILFPQLFLALFGKKVNSIGSVVGFIVALVLRLGGGEEVLGIESFINYPMLKDGEIMFPFRTFSMLSSLLTIIIVSRLTLHISPSRSLFKVKITNNESA